MRKSFKAFAFGIVLTAGCALSAGCAGTGAGSNARLDNEEDSIAYAVSMLLSESIPEKMSEEGIDSTTLDEFIRGMRMAFPLDDTAEERAFLSGIYAAAEAANMLEQVDRSIYPDEMGKKVDRRVFLEGLIANASGNKEVMNNDFARAYYNTKIFRARSEQFIADNTKRPGVVTLPSGVQYKIEIQGKGEKNEYPDKVTCIYKGTFPNGAVFSSSQGKCVELDVDGLVPGLAEVLTTLPAGTRFKAYIPWNLAYGAKGSNSIPPYSALVYDIEIIETK